MRDKVGFSVTGKVVLGAGCWEHFDLQSANPSSLIGDELGRLAYVCATILTAWGQSRQHTFQPLW